MPFVWLFMIELLCASNGSVCLNGGHSAPAMV